MRGVYRIDREPLVLPREHVGPYYFGKIEYYRVLYVEALYPFRHDFGAIPAEKKTDKKNLKAEGFEPETEEELVELFVEPIDDVQIEKYNPGEHEMHTFAKFGATRIQKRIVDHHRSDRYTVTGVRGPLWKITTNRRARVKRLTFSNESAADAWIYLCKSDGTRLSASYRVLAGQTRVLDEDDLDAEFADDIYINIDQQPTSCDIKIVAKAFEDYKQFPVIYLMKDKLSHIILHNPTTYDLPTSLVEFSGYRYLLERVEEPPKWTFVPLVAYG